MKRFLQRIFAILLCLLLAFSAVMIPLPAAAAEDEAEADADAEVEAEAEDEDEAETSENEEEAAELSGQERGQVTVRFIDPTGETELTLDFGGVLTIEDGPEIEGYTFRGWQDAWGRWELRESLHVWEDTAYYAVYAMALGKNPKHEPYLYLDAEGAFHPNDPMSRRIAARIIYRLLDTKLVGDGVFLDVEKNDSCRKAVATLKSLGALSGSRFYPDDTITRRELFEILSHFFPIPRENPAFTDLSRDDPSYPAFALAVEQGWIEGDEADADREITRIEAAHIFNLVQGRRGDSAERMEVVGTITDVSRMNPWFWDVAEAVISHSYETDDEGEHWTKSEAIPRHEPGMYFDGVKLRAADEKGSAIVDGWFKGVYFSESGTVSSGMPELDELLWDVLEKTIDPETMDREAMLEALYLYTVNGFSYSRESKHEYGDTGWEAAEAYDMLTNRRGNCYGYAAVFGCLAREIGCDVTVYSGKIKSEYGPIPHSWVEINLDGELRLFDPEMEMSTQYIGYLRFFNQELEETYKVFDYQHK